MDKEPTLTLFHATTQSRGQKIMSSGMISRLAPPAFEWSLETSPGWVYLSDHVDHAVHWGNKVSLLNNEKELFYIFKINLPLSQCHPDIDNLIYEADMSHDEAAQVDTASCLVKCHSCRTVNDLNVSEEVVAYCTLPVNHHGNEAHPLLKVVRSLFCYIPPHDHILYEEQRKMMNWTALQPSGK